MTPRDTVEAVIFDVGKVLYQWDIRHLYARLIPDPTALDHFVTQIVTPQWHFQHDAGRPLDEMVAELISKHPDHRELIRAYVPRWLETIPGPVPGSLALVERLAARAVPIYGITNFGTEFWAMFRPTAPVFDLFRDIVVSGAEKMVKPDPRIYQLAIDRFGITAERSLFIDDRRDNIDAARDFGLQVHHFKDAATLETDLRQRNLLE
jgi:2-haloacid dehalogenase